MPNPFESPNYRVLVEDLKTRVRSAQLRASLSVNRELVLVLEHRARHSGATGVRNLRYMRSFAEVWPDEPFVQQLAAQLPWFHDVTIIEKLKEPDLRRFYVEAVIVNGWSRSVLVAQIESQLHLRQGQAITNFAATLPPASSDLALQMVT